LPPLARSSWCASEALIPLSDLDFRRIASTKRRLAWASDLQRLAHNIVSSRWSAYFEAFGITTPSRSDGRSAAIFPRRCTVFACARAFFQQRYDRIFIYAFPALRIQTFFPCTRYGAPLRSLEKRHLSAFLILMPITAVLMESALRKARKCCLYLCIRRDRIGMVSTFAQSNVNRYAVRLDGILYLLGILVALSQR